MTAAVAATPRATPAPPRQRLALTGFWLEAFLVLSAIVFVVVGPGVQLYGAIAAYGVVLLLCGIGARAEERRTVALTGTLALLLAIPITRLTQAGPLLAEMAGVILALTAMAVIAPGARLPRGSALIGVFSVALGLVTLFSPDQGALLRFVPYLMSFLPMFLMFGQAGAGVRLRVFRFILLAAVLESMLAVAEPLVLHSPDLWAPAQLNALGEPKPLKNPLLSHFERAQGTLGHPLPLGVLLAAGVALLVRGVVRFGPAARVTLGLVLAAGLVMSGSRNSLLIAVIMVAFFAGGRVTAIRFVAAALVSVLAFGIAVAGDVLTNQAGSDFVASGSVTHRAGAYGAVPGLLSNQAISVVLTGNGWASSARLFADNMLQSDGLGAVDNEFVLLLSQGGLLALALFVVVLVLAIVRGHASMRPLLFSMVATLFVFDVLVWPSSAALLGIALAVSLQPARETPAE